MKLLQEFKEFAVKGNAIDMAVGIIIGAAFNKIVSSLVNDIVMPPIGLLIGGVDFKNLEVVLKAAYITPTGQTIPAVTLRYGQFINTIIDFVIVALSVFVLIKVTNTLLRIRQNQKSA